MPEGTASLESAIGDFDILKCMQCGTCSGSCPSGRHTVLNIRRLVRRAARDPEVMGDETLWMCTTCYNCQERCPRAIRIVDAVLRIREIAVHQGIILDTHRKVAGLLLETGHAVPIDDDNIEKRKQLGLSELPSTVHSEPESLDEVKELLKSCDFEEIVGE
ncbi:heterodisulfide reductase subunit C [Methanohalophilus levihalophilus]|uniref:CoB--CoM heterodisulfide reductase subunit C n=1 Tax=Methanohalophilus levihalophilus TaxID=1431282 RepID=UPI001AEA0D3A|nr:CoB--CoM heterodisulfide reductase subunit C [Methanohalophilus levihalophilus]MBP2030747.1 heterodisulfide reductase subunit C [Methanohalophilus levihalophilus]